MLVLSRKESQTILIGDGIKLTVVAIQGGRVKLGISAPRETSVRRAELDLDPRSDRARLTATTRSAGDVDPATAVACFDAAQA
jgi:carbon storage regulator